jgi:hypothetical protein
MNRPLFLRIVGELGKWSPYFTARVDCMRREGLSPPSKMYYLHSYDSLWYSDE